MTKSDKIQLIKDKFMELFEVEVKSADIIMILKKQIISDTNIRDAVEYFDLNSRSRKRDLVYMRAYLSNTLYEQGKRLVRIGELFNRDHSSIIHCLKLYNNFKDDKYFINTVKPLVNFLKDNN